MFPTISDETCDDVQKGIDMNVDAWLYDKDAALTYLCGDALHVNRAIRTTSPQWMIFSGRFHTSPALVCVSTTGRSEKLVVSTVMDALFGEDMLFSSRDAGVFVIGAEVDEGSSRRLTCSHHLPMVVNMWRGVSKRLSPMGLVHGDMRDVTIVNTKDRGLIAPCPLPRVADSADDMVTYVAHSVVVSKDMAYYTADLCGCDRLDFSRRVARRVIRDGFPTQASEVFVDDVRDGFGL